MHLAMSLCENGIRASWFKSEKPPWVYSLNSLGLLVPTLWQYLEGHRDWDRAWLKTINQINKQTKNRLLGQPLKIMLSPRANQFPLSISISFLIYDMNSLSASCSHCQWQTICHAFLTGMDDCSPLIPWIKTNLSSPKLKYRRNWMNK